MRNSLYCILQACETVKNMHDEINKGNKLTLKQKFDFRKYKKDILKEVEVLLDDEWDLKYLYSVDKDLSTFYDSIYEDIKDIITVDKNNDEYNDPYIHFNDIYIGSGTTPYTYIISAVNEVVTIDAVNCNTGKHFMFTSGQKFTDEQTKIIKYFQKILYEKIKAYVDKVIKNK